jgi:hypothetical protein
MSDAESDASNSNDIYDVQTLLHELSHEHNSAVWRNSLDSADVVVDSDAESD